MTRLVLPSFKETDLAQPICKVAVPLLFEKGNQGVVLGTAVFIGNGIALTAKHVFEEALLQFEGVSPAHDGHQELAGTFTVTGFQFASSTAGCARVFTKVWTSPHSDIAILMTAPVTKESGYAVSLKATTRAPRVGSTLAAFGYPSSEYVAGDQRTVQLTPSTTMSTVIEVHHQRRDQRLSFPCVHTDGRYDAGMSGGPVVDNETGHLCGLICSNMPPFADGEAHVSYVALLWPMLATLVDVPIDPPIAGRYPLLELAKRGVIQIEHWSSVTLDGEGRPSVKAADVYG